MAIVEVKVPQLSESVSEATMLQWKKKPGEAVAQDEILIELETDKVVLEVPAPAAGVLAQVLQNDGDTVVADQLIATIDTEAKAGAAEAAAGAAEVKPAAAPAAAAPAAQPVAATASSSAAASPAASKLLAEKGLSAGDVAGSGRDGRVTKGDALAAGSAPKAAPAAAPAKAAAKPSLPEVKVPASATAWLNDRPEQRVPMS
ncbi:biotin/lipoyl-containing protein, partial [Burkholderia stabilis]